MLTETQRARLAKDLAAQYPDQVRIERRTQGAFDPVTGLHDPSAAEVLYEGPGRVMPWTGTARQVVVADLQTIKSYWVTVPLGAEDIFPDDVVVVTASADPDLQGRELVVRDKAASSLAVERRLVAEDAVEEEGS